MLNLTKLRVPHLEMLCKSALTVENIARRDWERALEEGWHWKEEDLCRVESLTKEWTSEAEAWRRSFIKRRNRVGERKKPWGTPLETGKDAEVAPSTTTEIMWLDKKLEMSLQKEGVQLYAGSLANRALCQTLSNALEISRVTTNDSLKFLREDEQAWVRLERRSPVYLALQKPYWWSERRLLDSRYLMKLELSKVSKTLATAKVRAIGR